MFSLAIFASNRDDIAGKAGLAPRQPSELQYEVAGWVLRLNFAVLLLPEPEQAG